MKIEKNKIVAGSIIGIVVLFIVFYSISIMGDDEESKSINQSYVPKLEQEKEVYKNKLEAVDAIKEKREKMIPTIYDESKLDENGYFIEDKEEQDKQKVIDSIYKEGKINYEIPSKNQSTKRVSSNRAFSNKYRNSNENVDDIKKSQQKFFKANSTPIEKDATILGETDPIIYAEVNGDQIVRNNNRLEMRLTQDATINGFLFKKNTYVYGNTKFQPNRIIVNIQSINNKPVNIEAYDVQDGGLGIYVENSLRAEASSELGRDLTSEIREPIPGVETVKKIFRKKTRNIKVTVINKYQLLLKLKQ